MTEPQIAPRRDRLVVVAALLAITGLAWAYTARLAHDMMHMDHAAMRQPGWSGEDVAYLLVMWLVMMVAMMATATAPMVEAFATINRRRRERQAPHVATAVFVGGYLLAWLGFSILATLAQLALHGQGLLDPMMEQTSGLLAGALFVAAGLYQLSPLKEVCLTRCRSTHAFILSEWREGPAGAVVMGLRHGWFCIGCCGALMMLLFAVSVMDIRWVAALTVMVSAEKLLPWPDLWRRGIGAGLIAYGIAALWHSASM